MFLVRCSISEEKTSTVLATCVVSFKLLYKEYPTTVPLSGSVKAATISFWDGGTIPYLLVLVLGMVYNFIPFMILQINTSLSKMDKSLLEASSDLGANRYQTFWKVTFPLSIPGVISGISLVFLPAVSSFFIPKLLGGGQYFLIGNVIENQFITVGEWNFGSAISVIMAFVMMAIMYLVRYVEKRNSGNRKEKKA